MGAVLGWDDATVARSTTRALPVDSLGARESDVILPVVPMFHANAWGFPYSGWLSGSDMVMPGPHTQIAHLRRMIETARPTLTAMALYEEE